MERHPEFESALKATGKDLSEWDAAMVIEEVATTLLQEKDARVAELEKKNADLNEMLALSKEFIQDLAKNITQETAVPIHEPAFPGPEPDWGDLYEYAKELKNTLEGYKAEVERLTAG